MNRNVARLIPVICFLVAAVGFIAAGILALQDKKTIMSIIFFVCTMLNVFSSIGSYFILRQKHQQQ
ncbi:MAG: hypothetical protein K0R50_4222 [Eubacterium sp.]|nr:hypothetical protein [Eubacterium sp.]